MVLVMASSGWSASKAYRISLVSMIDTLGMVRRHVKPWWMVRGAPRHPPDRP
ncbi:MAG TPA: hypothetical protein VFR98_02695 [Agromyces sp.]|nr:hypothetical protein [Agromyces sp.]